MGQILLVRHGQASFGAADYDVLSPTGEEQSRVLGDLLAGFTPDLVVHGSLRRQRDTAALVARAAGWDADPREDPRWDELDHFTQFAEVSGSPEGLDEEGFQAWYERAMHRWTGGEHDGDYTESYAGFLARARGALADLADAGDVLVATSGGPLASIVTGLLDAGPETYLRLLPVVVNSSVTRVVSGRRGLSLVSFNEHSHLAPDLLTYR